MDRLLFPQPIPMPYRQVPILLLLFAVLPDTAFAQKRAPVPPAVMPIAAPAVASPVSMTPPLTQKQILASDTRLDRPITLDVISVPLGEVLQKESLDKSTDKMEDGHRFLLTAAPDCADLKLQVRLNNRPLRTLMTALAQMVPGTWTRTPHGYQLAMTKEAANARAEWWRLFLGEREKTLVRQRQLVLAAMQTEGYRRKDSDPDPEQSDQAVETDKADQHDFFRSLPEALKEQIAANMTESPFYEIGSMGLWSGEEPSGTVGWLGQMSPQSQELFAAALHANVSQMAQAPPAYQKYAVQAQKDMAAFDPSKVYLSFQNGGFVVNAIPFNVPPSASTILSLHVPMTTNAPLVRLNQAPLVAAVKKMGADAPQEWKRLAAYQQSRVWPNILPNLPPKDHDAWHPSISRAGQTDWLGEQGHMEYVSDYYSHGGYSTPPEQKKLPVKRPLATELDEMAAKRDVSWKKDVDGIYLVRNNRWYRDDGLEVPEPLLRRWFGALLQSRQQEIVGQKQAPAQAVEKSQGEQTAALKHIWDWAAEVFSTLTPWQIRNGLALFQPEEKDLAPQNDATAAKLNLGLKRSVPNGIVPPGFDPFADMTRRPPFARDVNVFKSYPHTAQLYGSLDDAGRTALLEGRLSASALSTLQLAQAVSLQPQLPQALQSFPPDSVLLGLGQIPRMRLEVSTPPPLAPPSAP